MRIHQPHLQGLLAGIHPFGLIIGSGIVADGLLFNLLLALGIGTGPAQSASFATGLLVSLLLLLWRGAALTAGAPRLAAAGHLLVTALLTLFLRDGIMSLLADRWKCPPQWAILAALAAGAVILWQGLKTLSLHTPETGSWERWRSLGLRLIPYVFALRLLYLGQAELLPEEAYYWNYAEHLDIGYLDHPPMVAWLIYLGTSLFGNSEFGVRVGALGCWIAAAIFAFRLARDLFDQTAGLVAVLLLLILPFFFSTGFFMTPDAPLTAAWAGALFYLQRALLQQRGAAWYGVGICIGLGMISKYSIALLGPAALVFILADRTSRQWLTRREPYLAILVALVIFSPVILWNANNQWASFAFQTTKRIAAKPSFSLHELLGSMIVMLTPAGFWAAAAAFGKATTPSDPAKRQRLFLRLFTLVPLAVFIFFSLRHEVKLQWTGPLWLAILPEIAHRLQGLKTALHPAPRLRTAWAVTIVGMTLFYGTALHYLAIGLPGLGYCHQMHLVPVGWRDLGKQIDAIEDIMEAKIGEEPIVVGMDRNFISSQLAFYDPDSDEAAEATAGSHLFGKNSLMYERWFPSAAQDHRTLLMVAWDSKDLQGRRITSRVQRLDPIKEGVLTRNGKFISRFYYRFAYGYDAIPSIIH